MPPRHGKAELARRADELEATGREVAKAEEAQARQSGLLERQAAKLAERERELAERARSVAGREQLAQRMTPGPPVPSEPARGLEIDRLDRLVAARRLEFPDRAAEWEAYLFELRSRAAADGSLPSELTGLIEDVFAPLL
jgi:hypothetical protein